MAIGDKQRLITDILGKVLGIESNKDLSFAWFINKHTKEHFGERFNAINNIFKALNGNQIANQIKRTSPLACDAYFGGKCNFLFEFDEFQHFSSARLKTLDFYPNDLLVNFDIMQWKNLCAINKDQADRYRASKTTTDFNFIGGRTAQRAYFDCFRDLLPQLHGLNPTLRMNEFETNNISSSSLSSFKIIEQLLKRKLYTL